MSGCLALCVYYILSIYVCVCVSLPALLCSVLFWRKAQAWVLLFFCRSTLLCREKRKKDGQVLRPVLFLFSLCLSFFFLWARRLWLSSPLACSARRVGPAAEFACVVRSAVDMHMCFAALRSHSCTPGLESSACAFSPCSSAVAAGLLNTRSLALKDNLSVAYASSRVPIYIFCVIFAPLN